MVMYKIKRVANVECERMTLFSEVERMGKWLWPISGIHVERLKDMMKSLSADSHCHDKDLNQVTSNKSNMCSHSFNRVSKSYKDSNNAKKGI